MIKSRMIRCVEHEAYFREMRMCKNTLVDKLKGMRPL
jgi:hypothetical protein